MPSKSSLPQRARSNGIARSFHGRILLRTIICAECAGADKPTVHLRVNQVGYLADEAKVAIAFAERPLEGGFSIVDAVTDQEALSGPLVASVAPTWGKFTHYYELDFSNVKKSGRYFLKLANRASRVSCPMP